MILRLAIKDLVHDWLLSTCLILAIASIIAPLLILFGLKAGTIRTMRDRLVQDPKNREIRPLSSHSFPRDWFTAIRREHPEIAFVIPMTRQISTTVSGVGPGGIKDQLSLLATDDRDPLLLDNGSLIPADKECVLTAAAARALQVGRGDTITLTATRIIGGRREKGSFKVRVVGILDARASGLKASFVRLKVLEAVEDFKDGRAVPAYGWKGSLPVAYPVYDGVLVSVPTPLSRLEQIMLINNTGFSSIRDVPEQQAPKLLALPLLPGRKVYLVSVKKHPVDEESVNAVRHRLRGRGAVVLPWIRSLTAELETDQGKGVGPIRIHALDNEADRITTRALARLFGLGSDLIMAGAGDRAEIRKLTLRVRVGQRSLSMPVRVVGTPRPDSDAWVPAALAGRINLLQLREVTWEPADGRLLISRRGYAGFRMYADSIDQVAALRDSLEQQGITVRTREERIAEVRRLDRYLSLIFWLIATVGVIGGVAALTASLYASVERKKKELNILRLLGFLKRQLVLFPVFQGVILAGGGLGLAGLVFWQVARLINHLFSAHLQARESLCTLEPVHLLYLVIGLFACSVVSATLAALQAVRLDPAEALRDE